MSLLPILIYPDNFLRQRCEEAPEVNDDVRSLLNNMAETMYEANGIGLAASQVGCNLRVIVVDIKEREDRPGTGLLRMVNPVIELSEGSVEMEEGCLSIPDIQAKVQRHEHVVVRYQDEDGQPCTIDAHGLLAVCLQHEIDHLNGVLFIDRLTGLRKELIKGKLRKLRDRKVL